MQNNCDKAAKFDPALQRMKRLMRSITTGRVDPLPMTTDRFHFDDIERAFRMMQTKEDGMIKPLTLFDS